MAALINWVLLTTFFAVPGAASAQERVKPVDWPTSPPAAQQRPVVETFFGTTLTDPYRYMERPGDAEALAWMKAQGTHTRAVLDSISARADFLRRLSAFGAAFGQVSSYSEAGGRAFYLERPPGGDVFDLVVREADGRTRKLVDVAQLIAATGNPHTVNYFSPSHDGARVAVGISAGGGENADLTVLDVASGKRVAGPIANARYAWPSFDETGVLAFRQRQTLKQDQPRSEAFLNQRAFVWDLKNDPVAVAGATTDVGPTMRATESASVVFTPGSRHAVLVIHDGVRPEFRLYSAPAGDVAAGKARWRLVVDRDADVTRFDTRGDSVFLMSHRDAPTFKILQVALDDAAARPETAIPARPDRVIVDFEAASDALYVIVHEGLYAKLLRRPIDGGEIEELPLPVKGSINGLWADPRRPGVVMAVESWAAPRTYYRYDPGARRFIALPSGAKPAFEAARYVTHDLRARARDDVEVPLSVIAAAGAKSVRPLLLWAYGSYGFSILPRFDTFRPTLIDAGATTAVCHVRGGGELGYAWRLAGKDANKPNTWRDLIACAEHLIAEGWTSADRLMIGGTSAGGITVGRAMVERPDLFAAVASIVPMASAIRAEFQQNGAVNIVEFGTIKDPTGFRNLLAMDAYFTLKPGTAYPAVLFATGLNDSRVDPWQPAKAAARMQALGSPNPVLLRVDADAGHGAGLTRKQYEERDADLAAFLFWRSGLAGWQPKARR